MWNETPLLKNQISVGVGGEEFLTMSCGKQDTSIHNAVLSGKTKSL